MKRAVLVMVVASCAAESSDGIDSFGDKLSVMQSELVTDACLRTSNPLKGIDVSHHQATIDWQAIKNAGVHYAFIRASDGLNFPDTQFDRNWAEAKAKGIRRGVYQYFHPGQDVIAQADYLLGKINYTLEPGDLPPVIDIEDEDGLAPSVVAAKAKQWLDYISAELGVTPIIYVGAYFWEDKVGAPAWGADYPLWHAAYPQNQAATCTKISSTWSHFTFWQHTDMGSVGGISPIDMNKFDGTEEELDALTVGGVAASCGVIAAEGGVIDDGDRCFVKGGPSATMREVTSAGEGGDLVWTYTTASANEGNYGEWRLDFAEAGRYRVEVYTDAAFSMSAQARYEIYAAGVDHTVMIDQTAVDGWQVLGEFSFAAGADQEIHLSDNTGEALANQVQLVFDAVRLTRLDLPEDPDDDEEPPAGEAGCCRATGPSGMAPALVPMLVLGLRRRRRRS